MTGIPGRLSRLSVSDDGGTTYQPVGGIVDAGPDFTVDPLETTTHDSAGHREYIPNHDSATMDVSMRWLDGDPGQDIMLESILLKKTFLIKFTMQTAVGRRLFTGSGFVTKGNPKGPLDDTASFDCTLQLSGVQLSAQT